MTLTRGQIGQRPADEWDNDSSPYDLFDPPEWHTQAACKGLVTLMHPLRGDNIGNRQAKAVCATCPVITQCLEYALNCPHNEHGILGGLSERQRRVMRRQRKQAA